MLSQPVVWRAMKSAENTLQMTQRAPALLGKRVDIILAPLRHLHASRRIGPYQGANLVEAYSLGGRILVRSAVHEEDTEDRA